MSQVGGKLVETIQKGAEQKWDQFTGWFKTKLQKLRDMLPSSDAKEGPLSTLTKSGIAFWETFANGLHQGEGALLSAFKATLSSLSTSLFDKFGSLAKSLGGFLGKALGSMLPMIGPVVGELVGGILDLFKKNWSKEASKMAKELGFDISKGLADSIGDLAKSIGDTDTAITLSLGKIADEVGITAQNFDDFAKRTRDVFSFLERGQISVAQASEVLNEMWGKLAVVGTDSFGRINGQMKELIALAKQAGVEVPAITEFLKQQADTLSKSLTDILQYDFLSDSNVEGFAEM